MSNILEGKTILDIKLAADKKAIKFITDKGDVIAIADGGCCSITWVESIELPINGFPALVLSVEDLNLNKENEEIGCEVIAFYGCKIKTDKGDIIIDYRNSSNGYYGGNLHFPKENKDDYYDYFYEEWQDIKD